MYEARAGENVGSMIDTIHKAAFSRWWGEMSSARDHERNWLMLHNIYFWVEAHTI